MSDSRPLRPVPADLAHDAESILTALAGVQPADGTKLDDFTWVWVQAFCDFDYEYAWLLDVRVNNGESATVSDYMAVFKGYDRHGMAVFRATWWDHSAVFPEVPDLYDALSWWAGWVKETRRGEYNGG